MNKIKVTTLFVKSVLRALPLAAVALLSLPDQSSATVATGLSVLYNFDDVVGSGTNATVADSAAGGGAQTGTVGGGALFAGSGMIGTNSLTFDGFNDFINVGDFPNTGTAFTLSAWVKFDYSGGSLPDYTAIVNKYGLGSVSDREFRMGYGVANAPELLVSNTLASGGSTVQAVGADDILATDNTWQHMASTFDGATGTARLYLNGINVSTATNLSVPNFDTTGAGALLLGAETTATNGSTQRRYLTGAMDDFGLWEAVKTPEEMALIYGLGMFDSLSLDSTGIDLVLEAFNSETSASSGVNTWEYATGLGSGIVGTTGGTIMDGDAFIVLDSSGNGVHLVAVPEPSTYALILSSVSCLLVVLRRRK